MAFDLLILDCDGVLVDSEPISNRILAERLTAIGLPTTTEESMATFMGRSWAWGIGEIEARLGRPVPEDFSARYHEELFGAFERDLRSVEGIAAALDQIDLPSCVASSGDHERIRAALRPAGLLERFEGRIFSAADVERGKPWPDLFLHAARSMGADPERCVVVEDSVAGAQAGRAAAMTVLGYAALTDPETLRAEGARVFASMDELPGLVSGCAPR